MADQEPPKRGGNPAWVKGGPSPNPSGRSRRDAEPAPQRGASAWSVAPLRMDGWINALTGQGIRGRDKSTATCFEVEPVTGEEALDIWRGDPLGARIVETPPKEALRQGYELQIGENETPETYKPPEIEPPPTRTPGQPIAPGPPPKQSKTDAFRARHPSAFDRRIRAAITRARIDAGDAKPLQAAITRLFERLHVDSAIKEALCYRRAYGGGAILIGANDYTTDMRQPLDLKKVRSLDWLTPLEARELIPLYWYNNPRAPKFGRPAIYQLIPYVVGAPVDGGATPVTVTQIHESRLIIFDGVRVSRRITSTATWGWGDSIFTRIKRALRAFSSGHQNAETLLADFAQAVYKIKNLAEVLAQEGSGGGSLADKLMAVEMARSIIRAIAIDSDEDFERKSTSLAGYPETLDRLSLWLCATSGMPATMLMGQSPAGMNATGASDIRLFYDQIATDQTLEVAPALLYLTRIGLASLGEDPDSIPHSVKFNALWQPTEKEIADAHFTQAQADAIYLDHEVVSPEEIALSRWGSDRYSPDTHLDFEARRAQEAVVAPIVNARPKKPPPVPPPSGADPSGLAPSGVPGPMPDDAKTPADDPDEPDRMDGEGGSDDQPRDEQGRFGSASGAASDASKKAKSVEARASRYPEAQQSEVRAIAARAHEAAATAHGAAADVARSAGLDKEARAHDRKAAQHQASAVTLRTTRAISSELRAPTAAEQERTKSTFSASEIEAATRALRGDYSPDQERDEHGKFGGGGSSPGHGARASSKAAAASAHAHGSGKAEDHAKAAGAHHAAAGAHEKAGNHHAAASHEHAAKHHEHEAHSLLEFAKAGGALVVGEQNAAELGLEGEGKD